MEGLLKGRREEGANQGLSASPFYNAILGTTAVATMLEAGHAENALPQTARAIVNCRLLPGESPDDVQRTLRTVLADDQISITPLKPAKQSPASPLTPEIMGALQHAKDSLWPGIPI